MHGLFSTLSTILEKYIAGSNNKLLVLLAVKGVNNILTLQESCLLSYKCELDLNL